MKIEHIVLIVIFSYMASYALAALKINNKVIHNCAAHNVVILNDMLIKCEVVDENSN